MNQPPSKPSRTTRTLSFPDIAYGSWAAAQPAAQQAEPQTIQLGQTTDQVLAVLNKPEKIVNLGPKQIFVYRDLKVTFVDGKVSDVQ